MRVHTVVRLFSTVLVLWLAAADATAASDVSMKRMKQQIAPKIEDCRASMPLVVPMRSSGLHIVPLAANGYGLETQENSQFAKSGLDIRLVHQNDILQQLDAYMRCESPVMTGTQGMINAVADVTEADPRTRMVAIYQHGWSNGADALVVRDRIETPEDLSGARIAIQAFGPHLEYLNRVVVDARRSVRQKGGIWKAPEIIYTKNLLGFEADTPGKAFLADEGLDAAFVVKPDAMILTSGGATGTGAEGSVRGAEILLSTKSASRVLSEVYVVRRDYFDANRETVRKFVEALFKSEEKVREDVVKLLVDWEAVGKHLLDDPGAVQEAKNMWSNVETVGLQGNVDWAASGQPRSFNAINNEIQNGFVADGLMDSAYAIGHAEWDYGALSGGLFDLRRAVLPGFDDSKATQVVDEMKKKGRLEKETLFEFEIRFQPNQKGFSEQTYQEEFNRVVELTSTYAGTVLTIEGHSDPLNYLRRKAKGAPEHQLRSIRQAARNLSINRAISVRKSVISFAENQGVTMDPSQFVTAGYGINEPKTGMCGGDPCAPKTEAEWLANMRVNFRIVQVEAEASVFTPPNAW